MFKFLSKSAGLIGYVIQYGCLTHCTFEYLGDFVVVIIKKKKLKLRLCLHNIYFFLVLWTINGTNSSFSQYSNNRKTNSTF